MSLSREERLLVEAVEAQEREAYRKLGSELFDVIEKVRAGEVSGADGLPDSTLVSLGVKDPDEDSAEEETKDQGPAAPAAASQASTVSEDPEWKVVARLELARGVDPAAQSHLSLDERVSYLEGLDA